MKHIFSILFMALACLSVNAQKGMNGVMTSAAGLATDTIITSSSTDTVYLFPDGTSNVTAYKFRNPYGGELTTYLRTDSLSGSTAATAYLEYCYDAGCSVPVRVDTLVLNGATAQTDNYTDNNFKALYFRYTFIAASSTQTTKVQAGYGYRKHGS